MKDKIYEELQIIDSEMNEILKELGKLQPGSSRYIKLESRLEYLKTMFDNIFIKNSNCKLYK